MASGCCCPDPFSQALFIYEFVRGAAGANPRGRPSVFYWRIDEVNGSGTTTGTVWSLTTRCGDYDEDGDVDQEDFGFFQACLTGSSRGITPGCQRADLDADDDVDVNDFGVFQSCLGGPNSPPEC